MRGLSWSCSYASAGRWVRDDRDDHVYYYYGEEEYDWRDTWSSMKGQHKHRLDYVLAKSSVHCHNCGLFIADHEGCYSCAGCSYAAHKACADLPSIISGHPCHRRNLHGGNELSLTTLQPPSGRNECFYCREPVHGDADPYYTCFYCTRYDSTSSRWSFSFIMHAWCALTPLPEMQDRDDDECMYTCHRRRMVPVADRGIPASTCFSCGSPWSGPAYLCATAPHCSNFFHKACAEVPRTTLHPRHPDHDLVIDAGRPESCGACGRRGRHVYYCKRRTLVSYDHVENEKRCPSFALGVECVFRGMGLRSGLTTSHDHALLLVKGRTPGIFTCSACRKSNDGGATAELQRTGDVSFRCKECVYDLHFVCGPLPSVVKFAYHTHPLFLVDSLVEDESGEYYCDVCEEERDPRFRVYYCAPCNYTTHLHCLLSEIVKLIKDGSPTVEFMMLGESRRENTVTSGKTEAVKEWFFSEIVGRLTKEEEKKLNHVYLLDSEKKKSSPFYSLDSSTWLVSFLDSDKESKIEDVDSAKQFFDLDSVNFTKLCSKLSYFKLEKVLFGLDYKYLRMKVVDVGGYTVPLGLVLDLKTLLRKHGDNNFGGDSSLSPQMKSITVALLCAVLNKMRNTMAEDMSVDDLRLWYFTLNGVKKIAGYKIKELACFEESVVTTFLGFEAIRFEKDASESLVVKTSKLEAELEKCKEERERLKRHTAAASGFMRECLRKASESKWKTVDKLCSSFK